MNPIINSSFNKHPMSWELIRRRLLHPSDSFMKAMCCHQTLDGLPKHFPKKIHKAPFKICYTTKMTTINKGTTVDTSNLQPGEMFHMEFAFKKINSIRGFTSVLTVVCANTIMIQVFPTSSKIAHFRITRFILITLINEQHSCKRVIVYEYSVLAKSIDVKNLLVGEFKVAMENTGGDTSWLNGSNERHNRSIQDMVGAGLLDSNKH